MYCPLECNVLWFTDEKDGLVVSLKESSRLVEEAKEREVQMLNKMRTMEQQVQVLNERDQEVSSVLKHILYCIPLIKEVT